MADPVPSPTSQTEPPDAVRPHVPNHHAGYPGFSGIGGLVAALSMVAGRGPTSRLAADLAELCAGDRLVDVGCGPGRPRGWRRRRGASVVGVDPAAVMLAVAGRLTRRSAPITWRQGAAEDLPLTDDSATVLWSLAAVHHWADVGAGLAEAGRRPAADGPAGRDRAACPCRSNRPLEPWMDRRGGRRLRAGLPGRPLRRRQGDAPRPGAGRSSECVRQAMSRIRRAGNHTSCGAP